MKHRTLIVWLGCIFALVLSIVGAMVLMSEPYLQFFFVNSAIAAILSLLAIPFFIVGLHRFKARLQKAYVILCIGIGLFGLAQIQLPIVSILDATFWVNSGAVVVPYLVSVVCIFGGVRMLASLLYVETRWSSWALVLPAAIAAPVIFAFLPHVPVALDETTFDTSVGLTVCTAVFVTFAMVLASQIRQRVGFEYLSAMNWLFRALAMVTFGYWNYAITQLLFTEGDWYYDYSVAVVPLTLGALLFVIAGYTFGSIAAEQKETDGKPETNGTPSVLTPNQELEVALYVTNLVSNPAKIQAIIEDIRAIAARTQPGHTPSEDDQKKLASLYSQLESYLAQRDPLRVIPPEELRNRIVNRFGFIEVVKTNLWTRDKK